VTGLDGSLVLRSFLFFQALCSEGRCSVVCFLEFFCEQNSTCIQAKPATEFAIKESRALFFLTYVQCLLMNDNMKNDQSFYLAQ